ncbi:MAG TPA: hypothetical protein VFI31_07405, partial [Pirellulales bacterium]|nr:hypothetical protein [Pirellulales bacterium]
RHSDFIILSSFVIRHSSQRYRWLGQSWPRSTQHSSEDLPASDAPVAAFPGHRRGNAFLENHVRVAALPQPPLPLDLLYVR